VREALSRLTSDGIVENVPQKGFVVAPVSPEDLKDLTSVRIDIENRCLDLAIKKGDLAWEGRILSSYHRLSKTKLESDSVQHTYNPVWISRPREGCSYEVKISQPLIVPCVSHFTVYCSRDGQGKSTLFLEAGDTGISAMGRREAEQVGLEGPNFIKITR
jgi:hypothetical protein